MNGPFAALVATLIMALGVTPPADARSESAEIAYALAAMPGGVVIAPNVVHWPGIGMILEVPLTRAVGTCATGSICAYAAVNQGGAKLTWSSCGTKSTAALATVGSIANGRTSETLRARGASGTTVYALATPGSYANVSAGSQTLVTNVNC